MIEKGKTHGKRAPAAHGKAAFGTRHSPKTLRESTRKDVTGEVQRLFKKLTSRGASNEHSSEIWSEAHYALVKLGEPAVAPLLDAALSNKSPRARYGGGFVQIGDILKQCDEAALQRIAGIYVKRLAAMPNRRIDSNSKWHELASDLPGLARKINDKSVFTPAVPLLITRLGFNDDIREDAADTLAYLGDRRAYDPLADMAAQTTEFRKLYVAVSCLGILGDKRAVKLLKDIYFGRGKYKKYEYPGEYRRFKHGDNQSMAAAVWRAIYMLSPETELPKYRERWDVLGYSSQDAYFNSRTYLGPWNYPGDPDIQ